MISSSSGDGIRQYTPKSMSGKKLQITSLRKSASLQKTEEAVDLIDTVRKTIKEDSDYSRDVTKEILSTLPKSIEKGTIGESIYGCAIQQSKDVHVECTPECLSGIPLTSTKSCKLPIYVKSEGTLKKLNSKVGDKAIVYLTDMKDTLSEKDIEILTNDDVSSYSTYSKNKSLEYKKCEEVSIGTTSLSRTSQKEECKREDSSSSSCSTESSSDSSSTQKEECEKSTCEESSSVEEKCKRKPLPNKCDPEPKQDGYGWIFAIVAVVLVIIVAILVCWWFGVFCSQTPEVKKEICTVTKISQPVVQHCPEWC